MNKEEFLKELESLLSDISKAEREEALIYYRSYFEEAGIENEENVLNELGSPKQVAKTIKSGLEEDSTRRGEFTERGYDDGTKEREAEVGNYKKTRKNHGNTLLILILCLLASPIIFSILITIFAILLSTFCVLFVFIIIMAILGVVLSISGIITLSIGFFQIIFAPIQAISLLGAGLILLGIGLMLFIFGIWIIKKTIPFIVKGMVSLISYPFKKRKKVEIYE